MDATTSTFLTAGLVAFVGLATTWLNNYFTANREAKQWTRQQEAERNKRRHEEKRAEVNRRREIFQNSLTHLSTLISSDHEDLPLPKEEKIKLIAEAQKWLNLLCLNVKTKDDAFLSTLEDFTSRPLYGDNVFDMREAVLRLSSEDDLLFPDALPSLRTKLLESKTQEPVIHFSTQIDDDFRRVHVINTGTELPKPVNFTYPLSKLTKHQRELLADIYFAQNKRIPTSVTLPMPTSNSPSEGRWQVKINPTKDNYAEVLKLWEQDYRDAQSKLNQPTGS